MENKTPKPTVNSQTSAVSALTPSTVHSSQNTFLVILLSVLLLISVSAAGFFAFQTQKLIKELTSLKTQPTVIPVANVEPTIEPTATNSASATPDPTANWKTYTNVDYGFSFKYPISWTDGGRDDLQNPNIISLIHINTSLFATGVFVDGGPNNGSNDPKMILTVTLFKNIKNINDWVKEQKDSGTVHAKVSETKIIAGNNVSVVSGLGTVGGCTKNYFIKTLSNGYLSLAVEPYNTDCSDKPVNNQIDPILDQILSTFKFDK